MPASREGEPAGHPPVHLSLPLSGLHMQVPQPGYPQPRRGLAGYPAPVQLQQQHTPRPTSAPAAWRAAQAATRLGPTAALPGGRGLLAAWRSCSSSSSALRRWLGTGAAAAAPRAQTARATAAACLRCHGIHAAAKGAHGNDALLPGGVRGLSTIASQRRQPPCVATSTTAWLLGGV